MRTPLAAGHELKAQLAESVMGHSLGALIFSGAVKKDKAKEPIGSARAVCQVKIVEGSDAISEHRPAAVTSSPQIKAAEHHRALLLTRTESLLIFGPGVSPPCGNTGIQPAFFPGHHGNRRVWEGISAP